MTPEQTLDWLADQHFDQCREERPIQDWIRKMKVMLPEKPTNEWKQYSLVQSMPMHRNGWLGAWDALVAAITRKPRASFTTDVTVSFYAKASSETSFTGMQAEFKETP
jgi:hypothetical protein